MLSKHYVPCLWAFDWVCQKVAYPWLKIELQKLGTLRSRISQSNPVSGLLSDWMLAVGGQFSLVWFPKIHLKEWLKKSNRLNPSTLRKTMTFSPSQPLNGMQLSRQFGEILSVISTRDTNTLTTQAMLSSCLWPDAVPAKRSRFSGSTSVTTSGLSVLSTQWSAPGLGERFDRDWKLKNVGVFPVTKNFRACSNKSNPRIVILKLWYSLVILESYLTRLPSESLSGNPYWLAWELSIGSLIRQDIRS